VKTSSLPVPKHPKDLVNPVRNSYNNIYMANLPKDELELKYEPVQEDLDIIAQLVRFVTWHASNPHVETVWLEQTPRFRITKSADRPVSGKLDR
jgi:hypothetical protein